MYYVRKRNKYSFFCQFHNRNEYYLDYFLVLFYALDL